MTSGAPFEIGNDNSKFPEELRLCTPNLGRLYFLAADEGALQRILSKPRIAIVGSRSADREGLVLAREMAHALAEGGVVVMSGLALGIDAAAHRGALDSRCSAPTVAVLGHGLDRVYPRKHEHLAKEIIEAGGALLSPYPPKTAVRKHQFLERNGIIAALSLGTCVVQAKKRSGALNTARQAMDMGRDVLAVPGSVSSGLHEGCHLLLRDGASPVWNAELICESLGLQLNRTPAKSDIQSRLLAAIDQLSAAFPQEGATLEDLAELLALDTQGLRAEVFEMELSGHLRVLGDGRLVRSTP